MNIEQLPVEMLMKIFKLLPTYNDVSLVSKQFYSIACQVNNSTNCIRINRRFFERFFNNDVMDPKYIQSLRTSDRKVSKIQLGVCPYDSTLDDEFYNGKLKEILPIIDKFSSTIKYFKCTNIEIDECTFTQILSSMPNVEYLHLDYLRLPSEIQDHPAHMLSNNDLNLTKLTSLTIDTIPESFIELFCRLPAGILTDLHVKHYLWNTLNGILSRQWNIKKLKLEDSEIVYGVKRDIFDQLQLQSLSLTIPDVKDLAKILSKQTKLKSLRISNQLVLDVDIINAVSDSSTLEELAINAAHVPPESFRKLDKLKKLKDVTLQFSYPNFKETPRLKCFAEFDNVSLEKLSLKPYKGIPANVLTLLAKSVPHLKHLKVDPFYWSHTRFNCTSEEEAIMNSFSFVEILEIGTYEMPNWESNYLNPNLRELKTSVDGIYYEQWLSKWIAAYPNLQKLQIHLASKVISLRIRPILDGFTKLVSLKLTVKHLIVEDLDYLQNHKENLKFVSVGFLEQGTLTDNLVKGIRANFGMIHGDHRGRLVAAVDRYTMDCESDVEEFCC